MREQGTFILLSLSYFTNIIFSSFMSFPEISAFPFSLLLNEIPLCKHTAFSVSMKL